MSFNENFQTKISKKSQLLTFYYARDVIHFWIWWRHVRNKKGYKSWKMYHFQNVRLRSNAVVKRSNRCKHWCSVKKWAKNGQKHRFEATFAPAGKLQLNHLLRMSFNGKSRIFFTKISIFDLFVTHMTSSTVQVWPNYWIWWRHVRNKKGYKSWKMYHFQNVRLRSNAVVKRSNRCKHWCSVKKWAKTSFWSDFRASRRTLAQSPP